MSGKGHNHQILNENGLTIRHWEMKKAIWVL